MIAEEPASSPAPQDRLRQFVRRLGDRDGPTREAAVWAVRLGAGASAACYGALMAGPGTMPAPASLATGALIAGAYWLVADRALPHGRALLLAALAPALVLAVWHPPLLGAWGLALGWLTLLFSEALVPGLAERPVASLLARTAGLAPLALTAIGAGLGPTGAAAKPALAAAIALGAALALALELSSRLRAAFTFDVKRDALYRVLGQRTVGLYLAVALAIALFLMVCASLGLGVSPLWLGPPTLAALTGFFAAVLFVERPVHMRAGAARHSTRAFAVLALLCLGPAPALFHALLGR